MKHSTPESIKFKKLQRRLELPRYAVVGLLETLWIATIKNAPRGDIGRYDNETIAIECDWSGDADELVNALIETNWLDRCENHRLVVHDWADHAPYFVRGVVSKQGGFIAANTPELKTPTIVADYSGGVDSSQSASIVDDFTKEQPNITQPNTTQHNVTQPNVKCVDEVVEAWNNSAAASKVRKLTNDRRKKLIARLEDPDWPWRDAIDKLPIPNTPTFDWQPDFDWLIANDRNAYSLAEGKYDRKTTAGAGPGQDYDPNHDYDSEIF